MSGEIWRSLPFNSEGAGRQLALSESLLTNLDRPTLYWYAAPRPTLILGAAQKPDLLDLEACQSAGFEVYRRTSGGTVVLAGPDFLSLDIGLPPGSSLASTDVTQAYRWLGQTWVTALARLGLAARLIGPEEARLARADFDSRPEEARLVKLVCFGTLSSYEVVAEDGRKLVGLAQIKRRSGTLLQAGVHLHWPAATFAQFLALDPLDRPRLAAFLARRATGLTDLTGHCLARQDIIEAVETTLRAGWKVGLESDEWSEAELATAADLQLTKYLNLA